MSNAPLSPQRLDRFARHIVLPEVGGAGQVALADNHVILVGLGGIGSPALQYLAAAGIGQLTLIDDDVVDASNLQRQTIFTSRDVGHGKATSARRWLANFDDAFSDVAISDSRIDADNADELVSDADLVLDGTDNFATRLAVSDACVARKHTAALRRRGPVSGPSRRICRASARSAMLPLFCRRRFRC